MRQDGTNVGSTFVLCLLPALLLSGCNQEESVHSDPQRAIHDGWALITISDFDRAESVFAQAALSTTAGSRDQLLARYGLANAYQHRRPTPRYAEALKLYGELAAQDKGGEIGAWSALGVARIKHVRLYAVGRDIPAGSPAGSGSVPSAKELDTIRQDYQVVVDAFPGTQAADEAAICIGDALIEQIDSERVKEGVAFLQNWIAQHPKSLYVHNAYRGVAAGCDLLKDYKGQLAALLRASESRLDIDADRSSEYYRIAHVAETRVGEPEIARRFYQRLIDEYPTNLRVFLCKRALKRLHAGSLSPLTKGVGTEAR